MPCRSGSGLRWSTPSAPSLPSPASAAAALALAGAVAVATAITVHDSRPPIDDRRLIEFDASGFHRRMSMGRMTRMQQLPANAHAIAAGVEVRPFRDEDWPSVR